MLEKSLIEGRGMPGRWFPTRCWHLYRYIDRRHTEDSRAKPRTSPQNTCTLTFMQLAPSFADTRINVPLCAGGKRMREPGLSPPSSSQPDVSMSLRRLLRGLVPFVISGMVARMWRKRLGSPTQLHDTVRPISSALSPVRNVPIFLAVQFYARRHFA
jgi:hypothetical protein